MSKRGIEGSQQPSNSETVTTNYLTSFLELVITGSPQLLTDIIPLVLNIEESTISKIKNYFIIEVNKRLYLVNPAADPENQFIKVTCPAGFSLAETLDLIIMLLEDTTQNLTWQELQGISQILKNFSEVSAQDVPKRDEDSKATARRSFIKSI